MRMTSYSICGRIKLLAGLVLAFGMASCVSYTPADRIAENPVLYQSLPPEQQVLVQQGKICNGMSPKAVLLAWGKPNTPPIVGEKDGHRIERWIYKSYEPVSVVSFGAGYGYYGPRGWYDPFYSNFGTAYVPENAASVEFVNGKVDSWEARRP